LSAYVSTIGHPGVKILFKSFIPSSLNNSILLPSVFQGALPVFSNPISRIEGIQIFVDLSNSVDN
jgi:hypothetical protein